MSPSILFSQRHRTRSQCAACENEETHYEYRHFQVSGQQILEAAVQSCTL